MARRTKAETKNTETVYRVTPLSFQARDAVAQHRGLHANNEGTLRHAVATHLPDLVRGLRALGVGADRGKTKRYRLPFAPQTLAALREASDSLSAHGPVPATLLLELCLARLRKKKR